MKSYDLIIVGAGPVGLATAYQAAKRGVRCLVIEQFELVNQRSSSAGDTRQFRLQYSEEYMTALCLQTLSFWNELQQHSNETIRSKAGSLWFGVADSSSSEGEINDAMKTMDKLGIAYAKLTGKQIEQQYKFERLPDEFIGFLQPEGGTINVPGTINTLKALCDATGRVEFLFDEQVKQVQEGGPPKVITDKGQYTAAKVVMTTGPYANKLLIGMGMQLEYEIWQMVSVYFKLNEEGRDLPSWFVYESQTDDDEGYYYGFENCAWSHPGYLRIAPAFTSDIIADPSARKPVPNAKDLQLTVDWVKKRLGFLEPAPSFVSTCLAAIPNDIHKKMFLDFVREDDQPNKDIVIFSSGWSFKFVPLLGHICADLAIDGFTAYDISHFKITSPMHRVATESKAIMKKRRLPF